MKKIKLFETLGSILDLKLLESEDKLVHLEGTFGVCGVMNNNSRIYTKENYSEMIESLQSKIKSHSLLGELEHSSSLSLKLDNVSHRIDALSIDEDGVVHGEITLLDTPKGKIAKAIIEAGSPLYVSSKAVGTIDENNVVTLTKLFGYDLVGSPGFDQARVDLKSNEKLESFNESTYGVIESSEDDEKEDDNKDIKDDENEVSDEKKDAENDTEDVSDEKDDVEDKTDEVSDEKDKVEDDKKDEEDDKKDEKVDKDDVENDTDDTEDDEKEDNKDIKDNEDEVSDEKKDTENDTEDKEDEEDKEKVESIISYLKELEQMIDEAVNN